MKRVLIASLSAAALTFGLTSMAPAAPAHSGLQPLSLITEASKGGIEQVHWRRCHWRRHCWIGRYGIPRCHWHRVC